ncbi:MAG: B12-binding domain-containing radical SAM protein [Nanoarchaeota archaeon]|nr:B12-binding domain-containing radical SAM protein [Nanoarchaeota archaeon]
MNKKVYLLYPPISKRERYSSEIGSAGGEQLPLGIFYLGSYLKKNGFRIKIRDAESQNFKTEDIVKEIKEFEPEYVGVSSTTVAFHRAIEVVKSIKENFPEIKIILGGPHITSNVQHAMSFDLFDYGVLREGEITITELLNKLNKKESIKKIKGLAYREKGKLVVNPHREYIEDLDSLPFPAYEFVKDIKLYTPPPSNYKTLPVMNIITSRGCPNQCTFCDNNVFGRKFRKRSPENIIEEIKYLREKFNVKEIAFVDDTFLVDKERVYKLFEQLEKENIKFPWTCMSRINNVDFEFLKFLKSKGCWHISFGIESGDDEILKIIKKNISLKQAEKVINWCKQLKIKTKGFFIIGHPKETLETIDKTIKLACKLPLDDVVFTLNTPIPGSQQYTEADMYGSLDQTNWAEFNYWRPVFIPKGLNTEILLKKHKEAYRSFYLRPKILFRYFLSFFGKGGLKRLKSIAQASLYILKSQKSEKIKLNLT